MKPAVAQDNTLCTCRTKTPGNSPRGNPCVSARLQHALLNGTWQHSLIHLLIERHSLTNMPPPFSLRGAMLYHVHREWVFGRNVHGNGEILVTCTVHRGTPCTVHGEILPSLPNVHRARHFWPQRARAQTPHGDPLLSALIS